MPDKAGRLAELEARNAALEEQLALYRDAVEHMVDLRVGNVLL